MCSLHHLWLINLLLCQITLICLLAICVILDLLFAFRVPINLSSREYLSRSKGEAQDNRQVLVCLRHVRPEALHLTTYPVVNSILFLAGGIITVEVLSMQVGFDGLGVRLGLSLVAGVLEQVLEYVELHKVQLVTPKALHAMVKSGVLEKVAMVVFEM